MSPSCHRSARSRKIAVANGLHLVHVVNVTKLVDGTEHVSQQAHEHLWGYYAAHMREANNICEQHADLLEVLTEGRKGWGSDELARGGCGFRGVTLEARDDCVREKVANKVLGRRLLQRKAQLEDKVVAEKPLALVRDGGSDSTHAPQQRCQLGRLSSGVAQVVRQQEGRVALQHDNKGRAREHHQAEHHQALQHARQASSSTPVQGRQGAPKMSESGNQKQLRGGVHANVYQAKGHNRRWGG
mmetsp:Transcript_7829/g.18197  ORF Transcript_7829/g.18197 Transcript_7829/m.18197 type:complete len:243 (-) Transcript_7829:2789-3517(-)